MEINNSHYGGFVISNNILEGQPIRYTFREKSSIDQLNGWNLYSIIDNDEFISNPNNFSIINAESIFNIAPIMLELFNAPYGTDLYWLYENDVHIGFYDLTTNSETSIENILKG
ncbi:DUF2185 domain-containing protein [Listeria weihenstephanensis]|uniref:DUF2185 domain-containing protein n=1 Tax=Listeria weihenstephanensis TaxID=1006155 RepID=A0A841ZBJ6_9LIST|nr:DUF2185 domain-containing protein [Listeria weihenstephanensis]MBC1501886.1 DUF2185 domain-containing protein [Listeria weihenstephanensis]